MRRVRTGLVGCGDVALKYYLPAIASASKKIELLSVCDADPERAKRAMRDAKAKEFYLDYDEMLSRAEIEAVVNLAPHHLHFPFNLAALRAGKHVYTEKPMALSVQEANILVEKSKKSNLKLASAPSVMLNPVNRRVKEFVKKGVIGKVCFVQAHGSDPGVNALGHFYEADWYFNPVAEGGGPLYTIGIYTLHILTGILGPVKKVMAFSGLAIPKRPLKHVWQKDFKEHSIRISGDDNIVTLLDWGGATFGLVDATFCMLEYKGPSIEIYGSGGVIHFDKWNRVPLEVYVEKNDPSLRGWMRPLSGRGTFWVSREGAAQKEWCLADGLEHFLDCVIEDKNPIISGEHARHVIEVILKIYESAQSGQEQHLETSF